MLIPNRCRTHNYADSDDAGPGVVTIEDDAELEVIMITDDDDKETASSRKALLAQSNLEIQRPDVKGDTYQLAEGVNITAGSTVKHKGKSRHVKPVAEWGLSTRQAHRSERAHQRGAAERQSRSEGIVTWSDLGLYDAQPCPNTDIADDSVEKLNDLAPMLYVEETVQIIHSSTGWSE
jgi:hypothetical protein